jgi:phosphoglycerate kinase
MALRTLDGLAVAGKRVLLRADLNVPMHNGAIGDLTRVERLCPTIRELADKGAKVVVCSHFERPGGQRVASMSLAPMAAALGRVLGRRVRFAEDCIGPAAQQAVERMADGDILLLENTRFHPEEENNDPAFAAELAQLADIYVDDAFSVAHRAHASVEAVAHLLPAYAGRLMQAELEALAAALEHPRRPVAAIVGGSKVSTKIDVLSHLLAKVDLLAIGGAMANTFLAASGIAVGRSLQEADMHATARDIMQKAKAAHCEIVLPVDAVTAAALKAGVATRVVGIDAVAAGEMILDIGPKTVALLTDKLAGMRTLVWNGPLGAFETPPFDAGTTALARVIGAATQAGRLLSVAGGGDTLAALHQAGVAGQLSYVSAAGGAFLEWLEGQTLPGVAVLMAPAPAELQKA